MKKLYTSLIFALACFLSVTAGAQTISGTLTTCVGSTTTLTGTPGGGTWTSATPTVAWVDSATGLVHGATYGATAITYTTSSGTAIVTVTVNPNPPAIVGTPYAVPGGTTTLTDLAPGGIWSSSNPAIATVSSATGVVTGTSCGYATISYTLATGCFVTQLVYVGSFAGTTSGPGTLCVGGTGTMSNTVPGGTWSMVFGTGVASINPTTGVITGVAPGFDSVQYTITTSCGSAYSYMVVNVVAPGTIAPITGTTSLSCGGTTTLSDAVTGGTWMSSAPAIATVTSISAGSAVVTAAYPGTVTISYTATTACGPVTTTTVVTIASSVSVPSIGGPSSVCVGSTITLADVPGGTWSSFNSNATVTSSGVVTGVTAGADTIYYTITTACGTGVAAHAILIGAMGTVDPITGTTTLSCGGTTTLSDLTTAGTWSSSPVVVATISSTGVVTGYGLGTATITYLAPGCGSAFATTIVTVTPMTLTATTSAIACSEYTMGTVTGGGTYSWLPTTGLSCSSCGSTYINPTATTTYTITGGAGSCSSSTTLTVNGNRINGRINFASTPPAVGTCMVWLVQYNPADSSIAALDSMTTCIDSIPYYHFDGKAAGNYMVKAKLLSSVAGTSGYIPTYGASSANWSSATTITHAAGTNTQNITMIYGTVPSGPGFIGGNVYSGAGKGTSGDAPVAGMLVYLKNAVTGTILTYTYTDGTGAYSFSGLAYGSYIIYPEAFSFYTTPSAVITLTTTNPSAAGVTFKEFTTSGIIVPHIPINGVTGTPTTQMINVSPNPASGYVNVQWAGQSAGNAAVSISDIAGRVVYNATIQMNTTSGEHTIDLSNMQSGVYFIQVRSAAAEYRTKLLLVK